MLRYRPATVNPRTLMLGGDFAHVGYCWRPYAERPPEHRADYDRLKASMARDGGMVNPLIVFRGHVLIGQRRCEIAIDLGWDAVPIWDIQDDITEDWTAERVLKLRDKGYKDVEY